MYPLASSAFAFQRELQRQNQGQVVSHVYDGQKLYPVKKISQQSILKKIALPLADLLIHSGQQLKERYQPI